VKAVPASTSLYDPGALRTIFLTFENEGWEQELAAFRYTDVDVPAVATVDGQTYPEVGVHFRGASSYMMIPEGNKRSLKLSFDLVHNGQNVGGYRTLNLLNVNSDPTFVRGMLYSQIARDFIAAPQINYVRVVINGENWGVYQNAQQFNRDFLNDFFPSTSGARWKVPGSPGGRGGLEYLGDDVAAYKRIYEIKTRDDDARWAELIELTRVLNQTPPEQLEAALAPILDIDGALKFLALDVALVNSDGYWTRASDYNIYQDGDGRFHIIPHDINEALSGNAQLDPLVGLQDATKPLRSRLLAVPALRERYIGYVREIAESWLDWNRVGPRVEQYQALIEEDVMRDTRKLYASEAFRSDVANLRGFVEARRKYLLEQ
jgi:spore coat protein CotH